MTSIIDVAKTLRDALSKASDEIKITLTDYKDKFGVGVTDAVLSEDQIEFTLETMANDLVSEDDNGLLVAITISVVSLPEKKDNYFFSINIMLFKSNGFIINSKDFTIEQYGINEMSEKIILNCMEYIRDLSTDLAHKLLQDYILK